MALAHNAFFLNLTLADAAGNRSSLRLELDYADWAALNTGVGGGDIDAIITSLNAVTNATIVAYTVGEQFAEDTTQYGAAGSEVENVALITALIDGTVDEYVNLRVPAPVDDIFVATQGENRNVVDVNDVNIQGWLEHFSADGHVLISDGEQIADPAVNGNWKGKRIHRGSRKG